MKRKSGSYNKKPKKALEVLEDKTWMDVRSFAQQSQNPACSADPHVSGSLGRLGAGHLGHGTAHEKYIFKSTARGLERLEWLRSQIALQRYTS